MKSKSASAATSAAVFAAMLSAGLPPIGALAQTTTVGQLKAMAMVSGAPVPDKGKDESPKLKHWDGSSPLTIGQMSEMQRKKLAEDFLARHGFTMQEPAIVAAAPAKEQAPPAPAHLLSFVAIYGPRALPSVDLTLNGTFMTSKVGARVQTGNLAILIKPAEMDGTVHVEIPERLPHGCTAKTAKRKACRPIEPVSTVMRVGEALELPR
ncbi:hypothetical protein [Verminephrobacter eiseniae]|uniref:Uncharacterized protein n=2 Tax=Verminephrobacter eiseniae TaxID=364317 RepID=A1WP61_VEREI|nr:hypothetical protein [Verminephrobacter eiseniae]ABM59418.1 hypothetical protein Veis_3703 [Verminephrobacter eiseniae EF01-2]MCW5284941.1 hypothetical protein [Verminephrobacter eiseniae]MCW8189022.1 hypothetical protein [Verminephrobacter eiseniae]